MDSGAMLTSPDAKCLGRRSEGYSFYLGHSLLFEAVSGYADIEFGGFRLSGWAALTVEKDWADDWYLLFFPADSVLDGVLA
jgi:hypothetical protein